MPNLESGIPRDFYLLSKSLGSIGAGKAFFHKVRQDFIICLSRVVDPLGKALEANPLNTHELENVSIGLREAESTVFALG